MLKISKQMAELLLETFPKDFHWELIRYSENTTHSVTCITATVETSSEVYICGTRLGINCGPGEAGSKQDWVDIVLPLDYEAAYAVFEARLRSLMLVLPKDKDVENSLLKLYAFLAKTKQFLQKEET